MFHGIKSSTRNLFKRIKALFFYIYDYKVIFFCLIYVFASIIWVEILRNISEESTMGLAAGALIADILVLVLFSRQRHTVVVSSGRKERKRFSSYAVHFLSITAFVCLVGTFAFFRILPVICMERERANLYSGFIEGYTVIVAYLDSPCVRKHDTLELTPKVLSVTSGLSVSRTAFLGRVLIRTDTFNQFTLGSVCKFQGTLVEPKNFEGFDYKEYLKNREVLYIMEDPEFECSDSPRINLGLELKKILFSFKGKMIERIDDVLNEPQSSLVAGILFGEKRLFGKDFENNIRITGVSHVVAASGYNISILVVLVEKIFRTVAKKRRIVLGLIVIWLFTLMAGFSASIVRACIMSSIAFVGTLLGRGNSIHISIPLTISIFTLLDPLIVFDVGFLLSVCATLGLVYVLPVLKRIKVSTKILQEYVFTTLSCTLSTLPLTISVFKTFSMWAVIANTLILPVIEESMLWGLLSILFSFVDREISNFFFYVVNLQLKYFEFVVNYIGELGFGSWEINTNTSTTISTLMFIVIVVLVIYFYPVKNEQYNYYLKNA